MQVVKNGNCPLIKQKTINNERERENTSINYE